MDKGNRFVLILLFSMGAIFCFRFSIVEFVLLRLNKSDVVQSFAPQYLSDDALKYLSIFKKTEKNLLIGSSVFQAYVRKTRFFKKTFNENFQYYPRIGETYTQFLNEISLINRENTKPIIFFLQPGEISLPLQEKGFSWVNRQMSYQEMKQHVLILKKIYDAHPEYYPLLKTILYQYWSQFVFNRTRADGFLFSIFRDNLNRIQNYNFNPISIYFKLHPVKTQLVPYNDSLYKFDESVKPVIQHDHSMDINLEYMDVYLKILSEKHPIFFIELPYSQRCENAESLQTRASFQALMVKIPERLKGANFKFISKDELPKPPDFLYKDCIHLEFETMTNEKFDFLQKYFLELSLKLSMPEIQI